MKSRIDCSKFVQNTDVSERFSCSFCSQTFDKSHEFTRHQLDHAFDDKFICECGKSFQHRFNFNRHRRTHTDERRHICNECGKSFNEKSDLNRHCLIHSGVHYNFQCPHCEKRLTNRQNLKYHLKAQHDQIDDLDCPFCFKTFLDNERLLEHKESADCGGKFTCKICPKSCRSKIDLDRHVRSHTGQKPFSCTDCGKTFGLKSSLVCHSRTHSGRKPYMCNICGKSFTQNGNMHQHQRAQHSQENCAKTKQKYESEYVTEKRIEEQVKMKLRKSLVESNRLVSSTNVIEKSPVSSKLDPSRAYIEAAVRSDNKILQKNQDPTESPTQSDMLGYILEAIDSTSSNLPKTNKVVEYVFVKPEGAEFPIINKIILEGATQLSTNLIECKTGLIEDSSKVAELSLSKELGKCQESPEEPINIYSQTCVKQPLYSKTLVGQSCLQRILLGESSDSEANNYGESLLVEKIIRTENIGLVHQYQHTVAQSFQADIDTHFLVVKEEKKDVKKAANPFSDANTCTSLSSSIQVLGGVSSYQIPNEFSIFKESFAQAQVNSMEREQRLSKHNISMAKKPPPSMVTRSAVQKSDIFATATSDTLSEAKSAVEMKDSETNYGSNSNLTESVVSAFNTSTDLHSSSVDIVAVKQEPEQLSSCEKCGDVFQSESDKKQHFVEKHGNILKVDKKGGTVFTCKVCHKNFSRNGNLKEHMSCHDPVKPFACEICHVGFTSHRRLTGHMRTHNPVRDFKCLDCGIGFYSQSDLIRHSRRHTGEKPFQCYTCSKCFSLKSSLVIHERFHSGEKPYTCSTCHKQFSQNSNMKQHMKTHKT